MPGINGILSIASRAMWTSQAGVEVASHNIANMNTEGYSRQTAVIETSTPVLVNGLLLGTGVDITKITSLQDRFINYQLFTSSSLLGYADTRSNNLSTIEEIFNETTDDAGLSGALSDFFSAWQDLSATPEGQAERVALIGQAEVLLSRFHSIDSRLTDIEASTNAAINDEVSQVNGLVTQIVDLNLKIRDIEASGQTASDFRAERVQLMKDLGSYVDFSTFEDIDGTVNITLANGLSLIESNTAGKLITLGNSEGNYDVYFEDSAGNQTNITQKLEEGMIAGNIQIRDVEIPGVKAKYDEMAYQLVDSVNTAHNAGYGLNGTTGIDFFAALSSQDGAAAAIAMDDTVVDDVNYIAASLSGEVGDNQNALAIADIENALLFNGGTWTFQDYHSSIIADIGVKAQSAANEADHQTSMYNQIENLRESLVGVSLEDEMASLIKYQQSFSASARLFNTVSEMMDTLAAMKT